ncbi:hypothetical protein FISHEDRAFT_37463 [Fistulina hepatica ATCC 64428]|uniref:Copper transport protein n=1 Tax=Fistulina hepatica ATCC 64428 TaxID=1128425 RepID=A0A0D7AKU2_9AGAR|nr:hypothetical protein FISHEDRAFT_37463 [Fistulina hepatica ATCC 64428]
MSSSSSDSSTTMDMVPYLHFTPGDYLLFKSWTPSSAGAMAGACIGLMLFAIFDRWVWAMRLVLERRWSGYVHDGDGVESVSLSSPSPAPPSPCPKRVIPPFALSKDGPRGLMQAFQSLVNFTLMLAVMTFNAGFIVSIIVGLGLGEMLFGRWKAGHLSSH